MQSTNKTEKVIITVKKKKQMSGREGRRVLQRWYAPAHDVRWPESNISSLLRQERKGSGRERRKNPFMFLSIPHNHF